MQTTLQFNPTLRQLVVEVATSWRKSRATGTVKKGAKSNMPVGTSRIRFTARHAL